MARFRTRVEPSAAAEIRQIAHWWRVNRPSSPDLFKSELQLARSLLSEQPEAGTCVDSRNMLRRVPLPRTRYSLYYRIDHLQKVVLILACWHHSRDGAPRF